MHRSSPQERLQTLQLRLRLLHFIRLLLLLGTLANVTAATQNQKISGIASEIPNPREPSNSNDYTKTTDEEERSMSLSAHSRALNQQRRASRRQERVSCGLTSGLIRRSYNESSQTWTVTNTLLRKLDDDLQRVIECTVQDDLVLLRTNGTIQLSRTLNVIVPLVLKGESRATLTCPRQGSLLISRASNFTMENISISGCNGSSSIIVLRPDCSTQVIQEVNVLKGVRFVRNAMFEDANIVKARWCSQLEVIGVVFCRNRCIGTHCVSLGYSNTLRNAHLLSNEGSNGTTRSNSIFFAFTRSHTVVVNMTSKRNELRSIQISGGTLDVTSSLFEDNIAVSGGAALVFINSYWGYIEGTTFSRNSGLNGAGGSIQAIASNIDISSSVFSGNNASYGGSLGFEDRCNSTILNCSFEKNTAEQNGGAINTYSISSLVLTNVSFEGNEGGYGGAFSSSDSFAVSVTGIDCANNDAAFGGCFYLRGSGNPTISRSRFFNNSASVGGAIHLTNNVELFMYNSTLFGNIGRAFGGGLNSWSGATFHIAYVNFDTNEARSGGALDVLGLQNARVVSCTFTNNTAFALGGAIHMYSNPTIAIRNSTFSSNDQSFEENTFLVCFLFILGCHGVGNAAKEGGALYIWYRCMAIMSNNNFVNNSASDIGGSVYLQESSLSILDAWMHYNHARSGGSFYAINASIDVANTTIRKSHARVQGGAFYMQETNLTMETIRLESNEAFENGGGIYASLGSHINSSNVEMRSNYAGNLGGGIFVGNVSSILCYACAFVSNKASIGAGLYIASNDSIPIVAQLQNSHFENNSALLLGGGIGFFAPQNRSINCSRFSMTCGHIVLLSTSFVDNYANQSGAIILTTDPSRVLSSCEHRERRKQDFLKKREFDDLEIIDPRQPCPSWMRNSVSRNAYGRVVGTYGRETVLTIDRTDEVKLAGNKTSGYVLENVISGRQLPTITLTILDAYGVGPALTQPRSFEARISSPDDFFIGVHPATIVAGFGKFSRINGFVVPGNYTMQFDFDNEALKTFNVTVMVRQCIVGEETTRDGLTCQECDAFSYNFNASQIGGCTECPSDATCRGRYIVPKDGYWHRSPCHDTIQECLVNDACTYKDRNEGLTNLTQNSTNCAFNKTALDSYNDALCNEGYKGLLCGSCESSFGLSIVFLCVKCASTVVSVLIVIGITLYLLVTSAITIRGCLPVNQRPQDYKQAPIELANASEASSHDPEVNIEMVRMMVQGHVPQEYFRNRHEPSTSQTPDTSAKQESEYELTRWRTTEIFKIMLNFLQTTAAAATISVNWTDGVLNLFKAAEYVGALTTVALSRPVDCLISSTSAIVRAIWRMLMSLFVPGIVVGMFISVWGYLTVRDKKGLSYFWRRSTLSIIAVTYISYLGLTEMAVRAFYCVNIYDSNDPSDNSKQRHWALDTAIKCYGKDHSSIIAIGVVVLCLVTVLFPLMSAVVLSWNKERIKQRDSWVFETTGFLFRAFKESCLFWESLVMLRKAFLSLIVVFSYPLGGDSQGLLASLLLLFCLYIQLSMRPYRKEFANLNQFESVSLLVSGSTFILGLFFANNRCSDSVKVFLAAIIIIGNSTFFLFLVFAFSCSTIVHLRVLLRCENNPLPDDAPWWRVLKTYIASRTKQILDFSQTV